MAATATAAAAGRRPGIIQGIMLLPAFSALSIVCFVVAGAAIAGALLGRHSAAAAAAAAI